MTSSRTPRLIAAFTWQIWRLNQDGITLSASSFLAFALLIRLVADGETTVTLLIVVITFFAVLPLLGFLISMFTLSEPSPHNWRSADGFPRWMLRLPVRTSALVGFPMAVGATCAFGFWACLVYLLYRPLGVDVSVGLTGAALAATLVVFQAMAWTTTGNRFFRIGFATVTAPVPLILALLSEFAGAHGQLRLGSLLVPLDERLWVLVAAYLLAAYSVAVAGVARTRCGGARRDRGVSRSARHLLRRLTARQSMGFRNARHAQAWMDWQSKGMLLSVFVAIGLTGFFAILLIGPPSVGTAQLAVGLIVLMPIVVADLLGYRFARMDVSGGNGLSSFTAARPISTCDLYLALVAVATRSVLATWGLTFVGLSAWLLLAGHARLVVELVEVLTPQEGNSARILLLLAAGCALCFVTLGRLITGFASGIGRSFESALSRIGLVYAIRILAVLLIPWAVFDAEVREAAWRAAPWLVLGVTLIRALSVLGIVRRRWKQDSPPLPTPWWLLAGWAGGAVLTVATLRNFLPTGLALDPTVAAIGITLLFAPPAPWLSALDNLETARSG